MKTNYFFSFLFALMFSSMASAQTYVPMISSADSSDTWFDVSSCTDLNCHNTYRHRYTVDGDTLIGGLVYAKLHAKVKYTTGPAPTTSCTVSESLWEHYYGAMRESGKQVFFIPEWGTIADEYLAYDFNLGLGDTLPSPSGVIGANFPNVITSIDSVLVFGSYRKRFNKDSDRYVIEGIGASTGLLNTIEFSSYCYNEMLCYAENQTPDYFEVDCDYNLSVEEELLSVESPHLVKIVDCLGRETEEKPNTVLIYVYSDGTSRKVFRTE